MTDQNVNEPTPVKAPAGSDETPVEPGKAPAASVNAAPAKADGPAKSAPVEDAAEQGDPSLGQKLSQAVASIKTVFTGPAK